MSPVENFKLNPLSADVKDSEDRFSVKTGRSLPSIRKDESSTPDSYATTHFLLLVPQCHLRLI